MSSTTRYMTDIPIRNNALDESRRASEPIRITPTVSATKLLQTAPTISSPRHLGFWCSGVGVGLMADAYFDGNQRKSQRGRLPDVLVQGSINEAHTHESERTQFAPHKAPHEWELAVGCNQQYHTLYGASALPFLTAITSSVSRDRIGEYKSRALTSESYKWTP